MKISDNFLPEEWFSVIRDFTLSESMPWFMQSGVARSGDQDSYFTHTFYEDGQYSPFYELVEPILLELKIESILRVKANLYPRTEKLYEHKPHFDYEEPNQGCVFYVNDNNGFTRFEDQIVESKANRVAIFDGTKLHNSTTCTDQIARVTINLNW